MKTLLSRLLLTLTLFGIVGTSTASAQVAYPSVEPRAAAALQVLRGQGSSADKVALQAAIKGAGGDALARLGNKLRRVSARAQVRNAWSLPAYRAASPWVTGEAIANGNVRSSAGSLYVAMSNATTGDTAPVHMANAAGLTDGTGGVLWSWLGPVEITADAADAPTITAVATPGGASLKFGNTALAVGADQVPTAFALRGGYRDPGDLGRSLTFQSNATTTVRGRSRWEWETDQTDFYFRLDSGGAGRAQIYIDDRRYNYDGIPLVQGTNWFRITIPGGATVRRFTMQGNPALSLKEVRLQPYGQAWKPSDIDDVRAYWISDSIVAGAAYGPFFANGSVAQRTSSLLGWNDPWEAAVGGTGYNATGSGTAYTYRQRVAEGLTRNPNLWVLFGSTNDGGFPAADETTEVLATLRAIRAGSAAPIIVFGVWPSNSNAVVTENAVKAAVAASGDPLVFFIPIATDSLPWIIASWNNVAAGQSNAGQGQGQIALADGTHGTDYIYAYLARRMAQAVRTQVLPLLG